jgi:hypothetical protein
MVMGVWSSLFFSFSTWLLTGRRRNCVSLSTLRDLIVPLCDSAREWLDKHIGKDNGFQPYWPTAIVEPRYLKEIIVGIRRDGLVAR